ncbi:MAG: ribose 5-phosphate isomerase B [Bacteroidetes bacterium RIFCSPLOWO2_12_FULL_37_12]|nr:MAG: ribose 5-phosphate isomerase B [Bacteroidetes bacterium RIFCSPLOWO2_12_FULL_37_12]
MITLAFASDHAGFELKSFLINEAKKLNFAIKDFGTRSIDSVDYPDYVHPLANEVSLDNEMLGILICGSGNGVCMTANKHKGVRAALCWEPALAELARQHNNANILCLPARFISQESALNIMTSFLNSQFEGGRHEKRVGKIEEKQNGGF